MVPLLKNTLTSIACPSNCAVPTQLSATNITSGTVTLNWTAPTPAPGNGYLYAYSTNPIVGGINGTTTSTTVNLDNLLPGTTYYYWVAAHCATSQTSWIPGGTFTTLSGGTGCWNIISSGNDYTLATKTDGTLWGWGINEDGQLGDGTTTNRATPTPIAISGIWKIATAYNHTVVIKTDGTLWAWGNNQFGQVGDGTTNNRTTPLKIGSANDWVSVAVGDYFTLALKANGTLWAWGHNYYGNYGDGSTYSRTVPTQVGTAADWRSIAAGDDHALGIKTDGTLWAWGKL